ncbi:MAG TPA: amidase family protein [Acidimicrobiales bacterium]|nr:amidase family protein [Acidimicrobiales bacterium]
MPEPFVDACGLAELVRSGAASPLELVDEAVARVEKLNPELNAVIRTRFDEARREAAGALPAGPFRGVPLLLKDLLCSLAGEELHEGMQALKDARYVARHDQELARRLRAAGFVVIGRTNTPELGILPTTEPAAYGPARNPWDTTRSTGGSSGGSAAAVASGMVSVAHANDGGGSIRIPASACGLVGLKPSRARVSLGPDWGDIMGGLVCELAVTRTVRDSAAVLDAVHGPAPGDPYAVPPPRRPYADEVGADPGRLRIGLQTAAFGGSVQTHPECVAAAVGAARTLEALGHHVEAAHVEALDSPGFIDAFLVVWAAGMAHDIDHYWPALLGRALGPEDVEPLSWALADLGRAANAADYLKAQRALQVTARDVAQWYEGGFDLLLTPTLAEPPPVLGEFDSPPENPGHGLLRAAALVPFTPVFNATGQPAVSLPLHHSAAGLPIGVQLVAPYGREDVLIQVAAQLEEAAPWHERRPPVSA